MAARETVTYGLDCKSCGEAGRVVVTENDHPYMTSVDLRVKRVEGNFEAAKHGDKDISVKCKQCGFQYVF